jgi:hypothetical protein
VTEAEGYQATACFPWPVPTAFPDAELLDLGAAALDKNNQHNGKQNSGNNANQSSAVHLFFSFP